MSELSLFSGGFGQPSKALARQQEARLGQVYSAAEIAHAKDSANAALAQAKIANLGQLGATAKVVVKETPEVGQYVHLVLLDYALTRSRI